METFKKRQKEMKRLEKQRDKAAKRKEVKARKALGLPGTPEDDLVESEIPAEGAEADGAGNVESPAESSSPLTN
jgi:hypothetical protein